MVWINWSFLLLLKCSENDNDDDDEEDSDDSSESDADEVEVLTTFSKLKYYIIVFFHSFLI